MSGFADDTFAGIDWEHAEPLPRFLARVPALTAEDRLRLVDEATGLIERYYVHLPQKRATHGIDPVRRLAALRRRLPSIGDDRAFHEAMHAVFAELHDLHTVYTLPAPFAEAVAFLPFQVEADRQGAFIVTEVLPGELAGITTEGFGRGVEILDWNGLAVARMAARLAATSGGANPDAAFARGVAALTLRPLVRMPPPEEEFVLVGWRGPDGKRAELRCVWRVCDLAREPAHAADSAASHAGLDIAGDALRRMRKQLFAPQVIAAERAAERAAAPVMPAGRPAPRGARTEEVASVMPGIFRARRILRGGRDVGHLRLRSFKTNDADGFVAEFLRLVGQLPPGGLIIDVRDNTGGLVAAGEKLLQTLTPGPIEPGRAQFRATPEVLELCRRTAAADAPIDLTPWIPSLEHALATGAPFSAALPLSPREDCNDIGQRYHGPVVLIVNALCYSATDSFIAGFADHAVGRILGTDRNTGAGGANVWSFAQVMRLLGDGAPAAALPQGTGLRLAMRRTLRVGAAAGSEIEEVGVRPDEIYELTRADLLDGNQGLIARAAAMLEREPWYVLRVEGGAARARGLDRLDVRLDGRPLASHDIPAEGLERMVGVPLGLPAGAHGELRLEGWRGGRCVAALRERI